MALNSRKEAAALEDFVQNIYWGENLSAEESKKRLEDGVIEARQYEQHCFTGLLVTDNGYFLTARHCVNRDFSGTRIHLHNGTSYAIERICCWGKKEDVALVKAKMYGNCTAKRYRMHLEEIKNVPFATMARRDGNIILNHGFANDAPVSKVYVESKGDVLVANHIVSDVPARPGDSGGIAVSNEGRLMGLTVIGTKEGNLVFALKIKKALELVSFYSQRLLSR